MILAPDLISIKRVKELLYIFELLSRLSINFNKSSIYPLGPPRLYLLAVSGELYCNIESFLFTYFGLSLKLITLSETDWQPLLDRINKRLAAWEGHPYHVEVELFLSIQSSPIYRYTLCHFFICLSGLFSI